MSESETKQLLIDQWKVAASSMSYYNAAEGDWQKETEKRNECRERLKGLTKKLVENFGMTTEEIKELAKGFLCSEGDYL